MLPKDAVEVYNIDKRGGERGIFGGIKCQRKLYFIGSL